MVRLVPMSQTDFEAYLASSVQEYAQEHVLAGNWPAEKALQMAEESFHRLLPDGLATSDQYLFTIEDETLGEKVGVLWFAAEEREGGPRAFVYDLQIDKAYRRQGYGMQAFEALEDKVRALGLTRIMLHVFGHNHAAQAMYTKLGYEVVDLIMSKALSPVDKDRS
jgi:ribosomal protein S18 acetylase RimI-like enzyme